VQPQQRSLEHPHLTQVRWAARFGQVPDIERLEGIHGLHEMGQAQYRHAWAWVHFMLHGPSEARAELVSYLSDIHAHAPPGKLSQRLRQRVPGLERQFADHFKTWQR
jgi:hypothetical protein